MKGICIFLYAKTNVTNNARIVCSYYMDNSIASLYMHQDSYVVAIASYYAS